MNGMKKRLEKNEVKKKKSKKSIEKERHCNTFLKRVKGCVSALDSLSEMCSCNCRRKTNKNKLI